ncbi:MAG: DUF4153 domain-containing protein [Alphaproteobacteria bacterium]|nr:DUF4153 domain-containing protein [Alphaproteobacteria bacterium]
MDGDEDGIEGGLRFRAALVAVGLLQGVGFYLLAEADWTSHTPLLIAAVTFCVLAPATFELTFGLGPLVRAGAAALGLAVPLALLGLWADYRLTGGGAVPFADHRPVFYGAVAITAYIAWPYLQAWVATGRARFPYPLLFRFAWSNAPVAAVAAAFLGVFWLVLWLWGALFGLVGVNFFRHLFERAEFAWVFSGGVFALGVAIARENERLVPALRRVVLMLFQVLAPVLAAVSLLFLAFLPFTGLDPPWGTKSATAVLVCLMFALTLFTNAVVQDGGHPLPFGRWMGWLMAATLLALPVFAGIALYAIRARIGQYGLTPERFIAQIIVVVAAAHVLAYAAGVVLQRRHWAGFVVRINPWVAPAVALVAVLLQTPLADPYAFSARDQVARLKSGRADATGFDYAFLKFRLGQPGRDALKRLAALSNHPQQAVIREKLARIAQADTYYRATLDQAPTESEIGVLRSRLVVRPEGAEVPDAVLEQVMSDHHWFADRCHDDDNACGVLVADPDRDGRSDYVFISRRPGAQLAVGQRDGRWHTATLSASGDAAETWAAFIAGDIELVEPAYYDIRIGKNRLHF